MYLRIPFLREFTVAKRSILWVLLIGMGFVKLWHHGTLDYNFVDLKSSGGVGQELNQDTWILVDSPVRETLLDIDMIDDDHGWAVGANGTIIKYENGIWNQEENTITSTLTALEMRNHEQGWAVGNQPLALLEFKGGNWEINNIPVITRRYKQNGTWSAYDVTVNVGRYDINLFNCTRGVVVGGNFNWATIFSLNESGVWEFIIDRKQPFRLFGLSLLENGQGWGVGDQVILSFEPGAIVSPWPEPAHFPAVLTAVSTLKTNGAWAVGTEGVIAHYDGDEWTTYKTGLKDVDLFDIDMISESEGWAVGSKGTILHFLDGTWYLHDQRKWDIFRPTIITAIDMVSEDEGWAVGSYGQIWHYQLDE